MIQSVAGVAVACWIVNTKALVGCPRSDDESSHQRVRSAARDPATRLAELAPVNDAWSSRAGHGVRSSGSSDLGVM